MLDNFSNTAGIPVINDISEKSPQEQLYEMHNYLYQLQEWLDWKLRHLEAEDFTDDTRKKIGTAEDSGWKKIAKFGESFRNYYTDVQHAEYRKIGNIVYLRGLVRPTRTLEPIVDGSYVHYIIFTLPRGFRTKSGSMCSYVCQGERCARWQLTVRANGDVTFSRYADESGPISATPENTWLSFCVSFPVG